MVSFATALAVALLALPLVALLWHTPWSAISGLLGRDDTRQAIATSFGCAAVATASSVVLGVPLALATARRRRRQTLIHRILRAVTAALISVPMVLPPVVSGVALLFLVGRRGLLGHVLYEAVGHTIAFTPAAVVLAQTFVAMPFLVFPVRAALEGIDGDLVDAAATMGASRWQLARFVHLPLLGPAILAGAVMAFARALGEFGATITVAGNIPGLTQTVPSAVYTAMQSEPETGAALAVVMLVVSMPLLATAATSRLGRAPR